MEHQIFCRSENRDGEIYFDLLRRTIASVLEEENIQLPCEINVLLSDDEGIQIINREQRQIDTPTDVLSFPMFEMTAGEKPQKEWADPETGLIPLGDMVISFDRCVRQAEEYGHSVEREITYLAVHSVLHLLGYDHEDEGPEKKKMRQREEVILEGMGLGRQGDKERN
ncbi:MAG: rRNA maturation RNase YbeY [Oscillospiraceae bacterium]|nr:rRNA maturation RNase YbeY [Oscillospiraceae bacterium]